MHLVRDARFEWKSCFLFPTESESDSDWLSEAISRVASTTSRSNDCQKLLRVASLFLSHLDGVFPFISPFRGILLARYCVLLVKEKHRKYPKMIQRALDSHRRGGNSPRAAQDSREFLRTTENSIKCSFDVAWHFRMSAIPVINLQVAFLFSPLIRRMKLKLRVAIDIMDASDA